MIFFVSKKKKFQNFSQFNDAMLNHHHHLHLEINQSSYDWMDGEIDFLFFSPTKNNGFWNFDSNDFSVLFVSCCHCFVLSSNHHHHHNHHQWILILMMMWMMIVHIDKFPYFEFWIHFFKYRWFENWFNSFGFWFPQHFHLGIFFLSFSLHLILTITKKMSMHDEHNLMMMMMKWKKRVKCWKQNKT